MRLALLAQPPHASDLGGGGPFAIIHQLWGRVYDGPTLASHPALLGHSERKQLHERDVLSVRSEGGVVCHCSQRCWTLALL